MYNVCWQIDMENVKMLQLLVEEKERKKLTVSAIERGVLFHMSFLNINILLLFI